MRKINLATLAATSIALAAGASSAATASFNIVQQFQGGSGGYANPLPGPFFAQLAPPDVNGAVGMNDGSELVTEFLNGYYGVYTPNGVPVTQETMGVFWENALGSTTFNKVFGASGSYFATDPRIVYDPSSKRWFASTLGIGGSTSDNFLLAVSNTSNPGGAWSGFALPANPALTSAADFDTLAVNGGNVYLNGDMFSSLSGGGITGIDLVAVPKASLTAATPSDNGYRIYTNSPSAGGYINQPVQELGSTTTTEYMYSGDFTNQLNRTEMTGTSYTNYQLSQGSGSVVKFNSAVAGSITSGVSPISQPGTAVQINADDSRLSSNLYMDANGLVWGTQTVADAKNPKLNDIRYFAINPSTNTILVQGLITPAQGLTSSPNLSLAYASIAINPVPNSTNENVVIDFAGGSSTQAISTYVMTGVFNGSTLSLNPFALLQAGGGPYIESPGMTTGTSRWGDYSTIWADPTNPKDFWIFQELPSSTNPNQWNTWITQIDPPGTVGGGSSVPEPGVLPILFLGAAPLLLTLRRRKLAS